VSKAVYKYARRGKKYYRLGLYAAEGAKRLARELGVEESAVEILDEGKKQ
jgi:hypothetical protein